MDLKVSLFPEECYIFGVNVGLSVVMAWCVTAALVITLLFLNLRIRRFQDVPRGLQNVLEAIVDGRAPLRRGQDRPLRRTSTRR